MIEREREREREREAKKSVKYVKSARRKLGAENETEFSSPLEIFSILEFKFIESC